MIILLVIAVGKLSLSKKWT